jgi:hypothetical protein
MTGLAYKPLFLVGPARSGSTLLAKLLDAHPAVNLAIDPFLPLFRCLRDCLLAEHAGFRPGEPLQDFYYRPARRAQLEALMEADLETVFPDQTWRQLADLARARLGLENPGLVPALKRVGGRDFTQAFSSALDVVAVGGTGGETWVGMKEVWVIDFLPALARAFPEARFVVINRDPRGMLASLLRLARRDPSQMAHAVSYLRHWRKQIACLERYRQWPLISERLFTVRYEDLVEDPARQALALCGFLGLDYHEAMLDPTGYRGRDVGLPWPGNAASGRPLSRIETAQAVAWRRWLDSAICRLAELICWPDLELGGYWPMSADVRQLSADHGLWPTFLDLDRGDFSWRSDLGNPLLDFGAELTRRLMLQSDPALLETEPARCAFLFPEVGRRLGAIMRGEDSAASRAGLAAPLGE